VKLTKSSLNNTKAWEKAGFTLPLFNIENMRLRTLKNPCWIHFGAGNIFRGFIAQLSQILLNSGEIVCGVIAVEGFDYEIIEKIYKPHDNLSVLIGLNPKGNKDRQIIASIADVIWADFSDIQEIKKLKRIFCNESLQVISLTITEKGYAIYNMQNELLPIVVEDMHLGPESPKHLMSMLTALLLERYSNGKAPLALVSMDNCSRNGEKLESSVKAIANSWINNGFAEHGFLNYLSNAKKISFPWTMIDKITPRPSEDISEQLLRNGIEGMSTYVTKKNTYIAPFVNAEVIEYLVIEDEFPNGRPPLEKSGVYFTDRKTVSDAEHMKVATCLNPLHTALAVYGCLFGYTQISDEMKDNDLKELVERIGYIEGMPVVTNPRIIDPCSFIDEVITHRLPNPLLPDSPQRIATDTSQKMAARFGETIKAYLLRDDMDLNNLIGIPLVIAGWLRYLLAVDDLGEPFEVSDDPLLPELQHQLNGIILGDPNSYKGNLVPILSNPMLFAVDLMSCRIGEKIENMFIQMLEGPNAVRKTLRKYNHS
jgi:fructuronate reductase